MRQRSPLLALATAIHPLGAESVRSQSLLLRHRHKVDEPNLRSRDDASPRSVGAIPPCTMAGPLRLERNSRKRRLGMQRAALVLSTPKQVREPEPRSGARLWRCHLPRGSWVAFPEIATGSETSDYPANLNKLTKLTHADARTGPAMQVRGEGSVRAMRRTDHECQRAHGISNIGRPGRRFIRRSRWCGSTRRARRSSSRHFRGPG